MGDEKRGKRKRKTTPEASRDDSPPTARRRKKSSKLRDPDEPSEGSVDKEPSPPKQRRRKRRRRKKSASARSSASSAASGARDHSREHSDDNRKSSRGSRRRRSRRSHRSRRRSRSDSRSRDSRSRSRRSRSRSFSSRSRSRSRNRSRSRDRWRSRSRGRSSRRRKKKRSRRSRSRSRTSASSIDILAKAEEMAASAASKAAALIHVGTTSTAAKPEAPAATVDVAKDAMTAAEILKVKNAAVAAAQQAAQQQASQAAAMLPEQLAAQKAMQYACRIYVGNIFYAVGEAELRQAFSSFGPIRSITLQQDPATGHHKGYAFIEYTFPEAAAQALANMQGFILGGRQLKVGRPSGVPAGVSLAAFGLTPGPAAAPAPAQATMQTVPSPVAVPGATQQAGRVKENTVYVGSIQYELGPEEIREAFSIFGTIVGINLVPSPENPGRHKGFGFVEFSTKQEAENAKKGMNGFVLGGRALKVGPATAGVGATPSTPAANMLLPTMLLGQQGLLGQHGLSLMAQLSPLQMTSPAYLQQQQLLQQQLMQQQLIQQQLATHLPMKKLAAEAAKKEGEGGQVESIAAEDNPPLVGRDMRHQLMEKLARAEGEPQPSRVVILEDIVDPNDVDDELEEDITEECSKYGVVVKVHVDTLRRKVAVYVLFATVEGAAQACKALDGRWFAGKTVKASFSSEEHLQKLVK